MFKHINNDLPASIIVFFVALPLCLGIALASGAPLFSGIIAGIIGGIVVGLLSGSALGVSGPAAGLAVIVLSAIDTLATWENFLLAVVLAGFIQVLMGFLRAGFIAYYFPNSVITGMLSGIGLLIILKQIPHALGYDRDFEGDLSFIEADGKTTFTSLYESLFSLSPAAILISFTSILLLILWEQFLSKKKLFKIIQGPIAVILFGIFMSYCYQQNIINLTLSKDQLVTLPISSNFSEFLNFFTFPNFSAIFNFEIWKVAFIIAIIASIETLLSVEATDKLDPQKRVTPTNRELVAQGIGNICSGLIGGLPITQVIVRSSANISFGGKTKLSCILHGFFLLLSAYFATSLLNLIPLSSLSAILILVGYKLAKPAMFKKMWSLGLQQFIPFTTTILSILLTDLLTGITVGLVVSLLFTLWQNYKNSFYMEDSVSDEEGRETHHLILGEVVSFFNKANILRTLDKLPPNSKVIIDASKTQSLDHDISEIISNFCVNAKTKNIEVKKMCLDL